MKVRVSVLALMVAALPVLSFAYPALGGGRGLFRVQNALVEQDAGLTVSLHALARNAEFSPAAKGWIGDLVAPELSYAPIVTRHVGLELFGSWGGQSQHPASPSAKRLVWGFHDLKAGGKLSVPVLPVLKLGGTASYTLIGRESGDPSKRDPGWVVLDPDALPYSASSRLAWSGLATFHLQDVLTAVPNLMVNYGKVAGLTQYGAAVELPGEQFCVFVEALSQQPDGESDGLLDTLHGHAHVTPGVVIGTATSAFLKGAYTFSFGRDADGRKRPDEVVLGIGFGTPLGRHTRPEYGQIIGTVTDSSTGAPLSATVAFPDHPKLATLTTDAGTGSFKIVKVPAGAVTVKASAEGYETRMAPLMVEDRGVATATIKLPPATTPVEVTGRVSDRKTGEALAATVMVPEADSAVFSTDPSTGMYKARLMPGAYSMVVESGDYLKQLASLLIQSGKPMVRDFQLVRQGMAITLKGIHFDFDKATIKPESKPALDEAARILKENPSIKVEIQGHTDSRGSDEYNLKLSNARAKSVVSYLVQDGGIDAVRLTAKGFGESKPTATNDTDAGRALNRRVEFFILGQTEQK